jgi:hypothetical protein
MDTDSGKGRRQIEEGRKNKPTSPRPSPPTFVGGEGETFAAHCFFDRERHEICETVLPQENAKNAKEGFPDCGNNREMHENCRREKRRGASLPAAVQNTCRNTLRLQASNGSWTAPARRSGDGAFWFCRSRGDETQTDEKLETPHVVSYWIQSGAAVRPADTDLSQG